MPVKVVDLSVEIEPGCKSEEIVPKIKYIDHKKGAMYLCLGLIFEGRNTIAKIFSAIRSVFCGKFIYPRSFPDNMALSTEFVKLSTHNGTHMDAPYHYGPGNEYISNVPLEYCFCDGVLLDFRDRMSYDPITRKEIEQKLKDIRYSLKERDIVIIRTGAEKYWNIKDYNVKYVGLSVDGLDFLLDHGVRVICTDAFGLDQPFSWMKEKYLKTRDNSYLWPVHLHGRKRPYIMVEKVGNLDKLDRPFGFKIAAFPIKIKGASAGWTRVVAIFNI